MVNRPLTGANRFPTDKIPPNRAFSGRTGSGAGSGGGLGADPRFAFVAKGAEIADMENKLFTDAG
jgi:hypothetical protein